MHGEGSSSTIDSEADDDGDDDVDVDGCSWSKDIASAESCERNKNEEFMVNGEIISIVVEYYMESEVSMIGLLCMKS